MRIPLIGVNMDERYLDHCRRSTRWAVMAGALTAGGWWEYDWFARHFCNWALLSTLAAMLVVKYAGMAWYHFTD